MTSPTLVAQTTDYQASNTTSTTVTLPSYTYGSDSLLLFVSRNQTGTLSGDANCSLTEIANSGTGRGVILLLTPSSGAVTSFTLSYASSLIRWACFSYSNVDSTRIVGQAGANSGNTSSAISFADATLTYTADGSELALCAGMVNSTATWTTDGNTLFSSSSGNVAMMIEKVTPPIGKTKLQFSDIDRGSGGSSRNESSVVVILTSSVTNYLLTGGFETDTNTDGLANDWIPEQTTVTPATYTISSSTGVSQGSYAQRMQYTGEGTNNGTQKVEFYSYVDNVFLVGDSVTFSLYLSGSISGGYCLLAIEAHQIGVGYIAEQSTVVSSVDGTPTQWSVTFSNLPTNTNRVVFALLANELNSSAAVDVYSDQAVLTFAVGGAGLPFFMQDNLLTAYIQNLRGGFQ